LISYKEAIRLNPEHIEAHLNEGIAYDFLHEYENAIKSYDEVLKINPNQIAAVFNKGNALK
jgi:tetratricopeptide (TPR) repeat protein